jgi:pre-mRNA-processing factor 39
METEEQQFEDPAAADNVAETEVLGAAKPETEETGAPERSDGSEMETDEEAKPETEDTGVPETEETGAPETEETGAPETEETGAPETEDPMEPAEDEAAKPEEAAKPDKEDAKKRSADVDDRPSKKNKTETEDVEKKAAPKRSPELAKFWKTVEDDPSDFTGWTYLLQFVDSHGGLAEGREAFNAFLFKYPYCYGYWKKFADFEKRLGTRDTCMEVFERGVKAIPLSADLWIHFLNYVKGEFADNESFVRQTYERAIEACGREWKSDKLWDHFVKWELGLQEEAKDFRRVLKLYDQILVNPTQGLSHQGSILQNSISAKKLFG